MKIKTEVQLDIDAKAVYRDGKLKVSVTGSMPYANRKASGTVEGASKETLDLFKVAFDALLAETQEQVVKVTQASVTEATMVAARMGEL